MPNEVEITISADWNGRPTVNAALADLSKLRVAAKALSGDMNIGLNFDINKAGPALTALKAKIQAMGIADLADVNVPLGRLTTQMQVIKRLIQQAGIADMLDVTLNESQLETQLAKIRAMSSETTIPVDVNVVGGLGGLAAQIAAMNATGRTLGTGWGNWAFLTRQVSLFGGALGAIPFIGTVGGLHILIDSAIELTAVLVPAGIALATFGVAAIPTVQAIVQQMKNLNTVSGALGVQMPGLSGGFTKAADAVQPQVYQIFGEALGIANQRGGAFVTLAHSAGTVVDNWAARMTAAVMSGNGLNQFMHNAIPDLQKLGDFVGNLVGAFGNVLHVMPGYAQVLLTILDDTSKVIETTTRVAQPIIGLGLAAHGAVLYTGLLATGLNFLVTRGLSVIPNLALNSAIGLEKIGLGGSKAASGLLGVGVQAEKAATLPWGWISIAAAGLGFLVYQLLQTKNAAQQFNATLQAQLQNTPVLTLQTRLMADQAATAKQLAGAQMSLAQAEKDTGDQGVIATGRISASNQVLYHATATVKDFGSGLGQLHQESQTVSANFKALGGNWGLINAAGITSQQMLSNNATNLAEMKAQVLGTTLSLKEMGQQSGILGSDLNVMNFLVQSQYTDMQNLNQQWDTFLGNITKMEGNSSSAVTAFRQLTNDAKATGASFLGVNANSITLQNDFNQNLFPSIQQVLDGMRSAQAPTKVLANYMSTLLTPAVNAGALANYGMRTAIFDMAQEAGYTGPNRIGPLSAFIDRNAGSLRGAHDAALKYAGALAQIPSQINTSVNFAGGGTISVSTQLKDVIAHISHGFAGGTSGAAPGWAMVGERGPELAYFHGGETVIPNHALKGYAGGVIGNIGNLGSWVIGENKAVANAATYTMDHKAAAVLTQAINLAKGAQQQVIGAHPGPGGGDPLANAMLAIALYHPSASQFAAWNNVAMAESGWNQFATNPTSGAYGIPQALPFNKMPMAAWPGWAGGSSNPTAQITWMWNYMNQVYGGPQGAWAHEQAFHWYDDGGWLRPGPNYMWNGTGRPEHLVPAGSGQKICIEVSYHPSATRGLGQGLLSDLKYTVRTQGGGDVQTALGGS
jgi:hypothetical protein